MRSVFFFLLLLSGICFKQTALGQQKDSSGAKLRDTLPLSGKPVLHAGDTVRPNKDSLYRDSLIVKNDTIQAISKIPVQSDKDTVKKKKHDPRKATIYSAILPGAGQVYNKKYWKVPIVYAAVGIPAYLFFYNKSWYNKCQYALAVTVNGSQGDSLAKVDPLLINWVKNGDVNSIITQRDEFRKNEDYSVLFFLLFYGLNIVDATVDAHLKGFNVNSDLSFKVKPMFSISPYLVAGVTMTFDIHKGAPRPLRLN